MRQAFSLTKKKTRKKKMLLKKREIAKCRTSGNSELLFIYLRNGTTVAYTLKTHLRDIRQEKARKSLCLTLLSPEHAQGLTSQLRGCPDLSSVGCIKGKATVSTLKQSRPIFFIELHLLGCQKSWNEGKRWTGFRRARPRSVSKCLGFQKSDSRPNWLDLRSGNA